MLEQFVYHSAVKMEWAPQRAHLKKALLGYWVIEQISPQGWSGALASLYKSDALIFAFS